MQRKYFQFTRLSGRNLLRMMNMLSVVFLVWSLTLCNGQEKSDVEIINLHVLSTIQARFATTLITSYVANRASEAKEITFTAQLPDAAFISNYSMQIDDKIVYGKVKEKEEAKADFDAAKSRGESTGLVAKKPRETNAFTISVNIAAQSRVTFNLTYQEVLKRVHGVYKQIINLQPDHPVSELKVDVYITERGQIKNIKVPKFGEKVGEKSNKELLALEDDPNVEIKPVFNGDNTSSMHIRYQPKQKSKSELINGQLVVLYDVTRDKTAGDIEVVNGYFVHFFAPEGLSKRPKDIVFVLDKSGSMTGRKMSQLKDAMKIILKDLNSEDKFQIIFFSDETESWREESSQATPENVKAAVSYVESTEANGGTNIYESLQLGLKKLKSSKSAKTVPMILFLTDGQPTVGETNRDKIVDDTTKANDLESKIIIHGIAFGDASDYGILQKISGRNRGLARKVYEDSDANLQLEGFYEEISTPLLTELRVDYLNDTVDVSSIINDTTHNYYDGSEVMIVGKVADEKRVQNNGGIRAKVAGQGASGQVDMVTRSMPPIYCPEPWPVVYYDDVEPRRVGGIAYRPPIWCCPPPHCCWWRWCPPPPPVTEAPKPVLAANTAGGFIERMWAYQTIKKMLRDSEEKDDSQEKEKAKKKALELSLKYNFVTELTSMVVVKPNEDKPTPLAEKKEDSNPNSGFPAGGLAAGPRGPNAFGALGAVDSDGIGGPLAGSSPRRPGPSAPLPPPPAPAPTSESTKKEESKPDKTDQASKDKSKDKSGCYVEAVFIIENEPLQSNVDKLRSDYASATVSKLGSTRNLTGKAALVKAFSDGQGVQLQSLDELKNLDLHKASNGAKNSTLIQIVDGLFENYVHTNVKRRVIFFTTASSVQYAVDASKSFKNHGVDIYVVSLKNDNSGDYSKKLASIAQDSANIFRVPPSKGEELANAIAKC